MVNFPKVSTKLLNKPRRHQRSILSKPPSRILHGVCTYPAAHESYLHTHTHTQTHNKVLMRERPRHIKAPPPGSLTRAFYPELPFEYGWKERRGQGGLLSRSTVLLYKTIFPQRHSLSQRTHPPPPLRPIYMHKPNCSHQRALALSRTKRRQKGRDQCYHPSPPPPPPPGTNHPDFQERHFP